ncbi:hypothetical protein [Acidithiobacillus ferrivorans]|nr:hypothetical protein [Acidithiobacillus ferrivorans]
MNFTASIHKDIPAVLKDWQIVARQAADEVRLTCPHYADYRATRYHLLSGTPHEQHIDLTSWFAEPERASWDFHQDVWSDLRRERSLRDPILGNLAGHLEDYIVSIVSRLTGIPDNRLTDRSEVDATTMHIFWKTVARVRFLAYGLSLKSLSIMKLQVKKQVLWHLRQHIGDNAWKVATRIVHGGSPVMLNDAVLADAYQQVRAYQTLYAIHPLLGMLWRRPFREAMFLKVGPFSHAQCAEKGFGLLRDHGLTSAGLRRLHHIATVSPVLTTALLQNIILCGASDDIDTPFHLRSRRIAISFCRALIRDPGKRDIPAIRDSLRVFNGFDPRPDILDYPDMAAVFQIWKTVGCTEENRTVYRDWLQNDVSERPGYLRRAVLDMSRRLPGQRRLNSAIRQWARRQSGQWHAQVLRMRMENYLAETSAQWEPLAGSPTLRYEPPLELDGEPLSITELCSAADLYEEGRPCSIACTRMSRVARMGYPGFSLSHGRMGGV